MNFKIKCILASILVLFSSTLMAQTSMTAPAAVTHPTNATVFYLVRHAEKMEGDNPSLSAQGKLRALRLAKMLSSTPFSKVYTTDYNRTRETALAVAEEQHLAPNLYDPRDMKAAAETLLTQRGHILVVGHSNTTTELAQLLGAQKQPAINDANEFDRLYIITVDASHHEVSTVLLRY